MKTTSRPYIGYYSDQGLQGQGQYDVQGVYCGLCTASVVFLIFE